MAESRRRHGCRRPVLAPLCYGPGGVFGLRKLYGAVCRHHERGARPLKVAASMRVRGGGGADGGFDAVSAGSWDGRAWRVREGLDRHHGPVQGLRSATRPSPCAPATSSPRSAGTDATAGAPAWSPCTTRRSPAAATTASPEGNPNEVYLRYPRSPLADQSGAGFTRTPSDDATAYTWDLALTKRGSGGDKPLCPGRS